MAPGVEVGCRLSSASSSSVTASAYGCISVRLGSPSLRSDGVVGLVSGGKPPVLEMQAVVLVLAAFLPQLCGWIMVLMSDILEKSGGHCLVGVVPHGQQNCSVDQAPFR